MIECHPSTGSCELGMMESRPEEMIPLDRRDVEEEEEGEESKLRWKERGVCQDKRTEQDDALCAQPKTGEFIIGHS